VVVTHLNRYFNEYGLDNVYLPSPEHSKYINQDVLKRFIPVGGVRIEDDILVGQ
jgi:Xaa-Pro dipeptidase